MYQICTLTQSPGIIFSFFRLTAFVSDLLCLCARESTIVRLTLRCLYIDHQGKRLMTSFAKSMCPTGGIIIPCFFFLCPIVGWSQGHQDKSALRGKSRLQLHVAIQGMFVSSILLASVSKS